MHLHLNILVNLIITTYFSNSSCIVHYHDNAINLVHIDRIPIVTRRIWGTNNLLLDQHKQCRHFLLQCTNARLAFESTEDVINTNEYGMYNNRKYIIIVDSPEAFVDFFNTSLLTFVRDILVIYAPNEKDSGVKESTDIIVANDVIAEYSLFTHKYVGFDGYNNAVLLDTWYTRNLSFKFGNNLYPDKISDLRGRELRANCLGSIPFAKCGSDPPIGNEYNIIVKYAKRFNMTLNSYLNNSMSNAANWTIESIPDRLYQNNEDYSDMVYGGFPPRFQFDGVKSVIYTYEVAVPIPNVRYSFFMFLEVFDLHVWLNILLLYILTRGLVYVHSLAKTSKCSAKSSRSNIANLTMFGLLINQPAVFSSDIKRSTFLKYLIILTLGLSVVLVTAYNSRLASIMVTPLYENDINTLSELAASNLKLLFFDEYYDTLENDERYVYRRLYEKVILIPNNIDFELSETMLSSREYAVARYRRSNGDYFEHYEHLLQMCGKYKPITPELFTDYYVIMLRKNSMYTYELQKLVRTAEETGLIIFWKEAALRLDEDMLFQKQLQEYSRSNQNVILNLNHLKGIFAFWGLSMAISTVVFLIEVLKERNKVGVIDFYK